MDLLEPMRRAAELGCKWFRIGSNKPWVGFLIKYPTGETMFVEVGTDSHWDAFAAAVCECWWRERLEWAEHESQFGDTRKRQKEADDMIDLCRAFANEHGK